MFNYINGIVSELEPNLAVIDCGGVGYACKTTNYTMGTLTMGKRGKLYTHLYVREDIFDFSTYVQILCKVLIIDFRFCAFRYIVFAIQMW